MSYDTWCRKNTRQWRGYTIGPGFIYKDGDPIILFYCPLGTDVKDIVKEAREVINEHIEKEKQNEHSRNN